MSVMPEPEGVTKKHRHPRRKTSTEIDPASPDNPLVGNECQRKLPYPSLQSGQSFTLIAALHMGGAMSYQTHLRWKNSDGSQGANDIHLST